MVETNKDYVDEGRVRKLAEKVLKGELTPKEARNELYKLNLHHSDFEMKNKIIILPSALLGFLFCFLPLFIKLSGFALLMLGKITIGNLILFTIELMTIDIPLIIIIITLVIFLILNLTISPYAAYLRRVKGGTKDGDEPIIHIKEGPYAILRHPTTGSMGLFPLWITICFSFFIPFTIFSIIGNILFLIVIYYGVTGEEQLNVLKWGDEYRQFQKEVPRFNIILGIIRLIKRKKRNPLNKMKN